MKVSELNPPELDYWVAKAEGLPVAQWQGEWYLRTGNPSCPYKKIPSFTTDWSQGGPIIEREGISISWGEDDTPECKSIWSATMGMEIKLGIVMQDGLTALIAAMRAFVASKFGGEVGEDRKEEARG